LIRCLIDLYLRCRANVPLFLGFRSDVCGGLELPVS
jgi:hypothetical protein